MLDFAALAAALLLQSATLLPQWLPAGKLRGHEFVVGNLSGDAGDSLSINVHTGKWADFASGDKGGDLISLYAAIHHVSQADAAAQLGQAHATPAAKPERKRRQVISPVPSDVPMCNCHHYKHGNPSAVWEYRSAANALLGYVARYDVPGERKEIIPWTYAATPDGKGRWGMGQWSEPRPLYGLDDLAKRITAAVLIVEGEKSADAARKLAPHYVVVTWPGGSQAWRKADWRPLAGRSVLLWPDSDDPGIKCMSDISRALLKLCPSVKLIIADDRMDGWDAADAVAEGWDWQRFKDWAMPKVKVITEGGEHASSTTTAPLAAGAAAGGGVGSGAGSGVDRDGRTAGAEGAPLTPPGASPATATAAAEFGPPSRVGKWMAWNLERNGNGDPDASLNNVVLVLEQDPIVRRSIWYDAFLDRMMTGGRSPEDPVREWKDFDDINLTLYMQRAIGLRKLSRLIVSQAVIAIAFQDVRNCVKDWLEALTWDKEPRIDQFFEDHFGATGTVYTRAASRNFWISLVARVYQPGCKVDNMVILEGEQGVGKSNALQIIGGDWFAEQHESAANPKGFGEILQGKLLVEISEMDSFQRTELTRVKAVVSNRNDRFRGSYKHYAEDHPRQCVFVGTTNKDDWNRDETGARRFWPIRCAGEIDWRAIAASRDQFFAEAVTRFKAGESWWQMPDEETKRQQRERFQEDPWQDFIERYLYREKLGDGWFDRTAPREPVTTAEILIEGLGFENSSRIGRLDELRVGACLRVLGWQKRDERIDGKIRKVWRRREPSFTPAEASL